MRSTLGPAASPVPAAGGIFKSAAVEVLRVERRLMSTGDITRCAVGAAGGYAAVARLRGAPAMQSGLALRSSHTLNTS